MKEQYLALMNRTFDAYGADGVRLLGGIGNRNGRYDRYRAVGGNCVHLFIRAEHRPTSGCCFCMGSKRRAGRFRRFGGGNAEFFPIGSIERGIIGKAALRKRFCRRCTGQDQLPRVHEPFDLDVVPDR